MRKFFEDFWKQYKVKIIAFSLLRIVSFIQVLFWPYAFARVVNIMTNEPEQWRMAMIWVIAMAGNKVVEDLVRVKAKYELEKIGVRMQISLAAFFSQATKLKDGRKTGESVQAIKNASDYIDELIDFYRADLLKLPVNFVFIPIILYSINTTYLLFFLIYGFLYLIMNHNLHKIYYDRLKKHFKAAEIFWGTTYRKAPEVWREREDGYAFAKEMNKEGEELYEKEVSASRINMWRWVIVQSFSSAAKGGMIVFVLLKVAQGLSPLGNLVLISGYFDEIRSTLNIMTSSINIVSRAKVSLNRLRKSVEINSY